MLELAYALPKESVEALVPQATTEIIATTVKDWKSKKPTQVAPLCLFIWDEMVHRGLVKSPYKIGPWTENADHKDGIYSFVQKELKAAPVMKAYTVEMIRPGETEAFAEISLLRCFPNDIHIANVEFSDHTKPVSPDDLTYQYRDYHGLHIFPEFIERLKEVAKSQGVKRISLMVAHRPLRAVFEKYVFEVSKTEVAQYAAKIGMGFPMILEVQA